MSIIKEYTPSQAMALGLIRDGYNVFVTGKPGTGKTELLNDIASRMKAMGKNVLMTASTGLAGANLDGGRTIHSVLHWGLGRINYDLDRCCEALASTDLLVIDEASMLKTDILRLLVDCLEHVNKHVQIVMSGDFFQLPPVYPGEHKIYPFETAEWVRLNLIPCFLNEVVRQADPEFKYQLGLAMLANPACIKYFNTKTSSERIDGAITLCTRNEDADGINERMTAVLPGMSKSYYATGDVKHANFEKSRILEQLIVKKRMRVMALRNDIEGKYQNGSLGTVMDMDDNTITVLFDNNNTVDIGRVPYEIDSKDASKGFARIEQFPLRGGYAITIHKSQGQTFDYVNIMAPRCWDPGQLYVALSRARRVDCIYLANKIKESDLIAEKKVIDFYRAIGMKGLNYVA